MEEKSAFLSGFRKGLAAPFSLFVKPNFASTEDEIGLSEPYKIKRTQFKSIEERWADSWARIGQDMYKAMGYVAEKAK
jgi:hypothetical protein